jgi:UbiD family decarboxylase
MDLRKYLEQLEAMGEIQTIEGADWDMEIGALTEVSNEKDGPALLFDHIKGYPAGYRVLTDAISTPKRVAAAFKMPFTTNMDLVRFIKEKFKSLSPTPPKVVSSGPILEHVAEGDAVDMMQFPVPRWHEHDGGRFMGTADMVITRDPDSGWVNVGTYRVQRHDAKTLGLYISPGHHGRIIRENYWAKGKSCPVAVVFGVHPVVWMPSTLGIPYGQSELDMIGDLLGYPFEVVEGKYSGLPIPAYAEIAIEGECPPPEVETRMEGPFGEWPGYYGSGARKEPVIRVKRVMFRNNPIIVGAAPLKPPCSDNCTHIFNAANAWNELEGQGMTGITGSWIMRAGGSRYLRVISVAQRYAGHAKQVGVLAMSGPEAAFHGRFVIIVDDDIDPSNEQDVLWSIATRCDPATSIQIIHDWWATPLDPLLPPEKRMSGNLTTSRAVIMACKPYHWKKDFPRVNKASDELRESVTKKWGHLLERK